MTEPAYWPEGYQPISTYDGELLLTESLLLFLAQAGNGMSKNCIGSSERLWCNNSKLKNKGNTQVTFPYHKGALESELRL